MRGEIEVVLAGELARRGGGADVRRGGRGSGSGSGRESGHGHGHGHGHVARAGGRGGDRGAAAAGGARATGGGGDGVGADDGEDGADRDPRAGLDEDALDGARLPDLHLDEALLGLDERDDVAALHVRAGRDVPLDRGCRPPCPRRARACRSHPWPLTILRTTSTTRRRPAAARLARGAARTGSAPRPSRCARRAHRGRRRRSP